MSERKFAPNRYRKGCGFCLDHNDGGYVNTYPILDGGTDTGISVCETGHSKFPDGHRRIVAFKDREYPLLRDAIFAYEDGLDSAQTSAERTTG